MARSVSKTRQNAYSLYKTSQRWKLNRERKLLKLIKLYPNNKQLQIALANVKYRRHAPKSSMWTSSTKQAAQLIKEFKIKSPTRVKAKNGIDFSIGFRVQSCNTI